ncbi:lysophospholipid acyltransferase family protein [Mucilaginibacter sp.]|uniref:lysophospholipid acyltransferase family protein n=1 Tax=Mucilaginibacter sp. TaxID=1882438 RepID=UPI002C827288|nr:lysophospholipid acyltransferase family protein [Mucilaginibacter sp.]HTI58026.1 lysophospholipid acyltransferase family protein [Mucilaginibacter sp.]
MKLILKKAHAHFYRLAVGLFYMICYPYLYFLARNPRRYRSIVRMRRVIATVSSAIAGIFYHFEYEVPIDWNKTYVVCPNHAASIDISAMCAMISGDCSFMGKEELSESAVTSLFFRTIDVPVNRESKMSAYRAFKKAAEKLVEGTTMIIFPEGGIADDYPPRLQPFKNGPFRLAIEAGVPIVPVTITDAWHILWDTGLKFGSRPGICHIFVHKPIETAGMNPDDADALRNKVYDIINQKLTGHDH